jgi:predicted ATP-dependent endonuclease of OLD family
MGWRSLPSELNMALSLSVERARVHEMRPARRGVRRVRQRRTAGPLSIADITDSVFLLRSSACNPSRAILVVVTYRVAQTSRLSMRLIRITITGYRRFERASVSLDGEVLAFVGPNEAGKSSLFEALCELDQNVPVSKANITRGISPAPGSDQIVTEARYLLDPTERELAQQSPGEDIPRWYKLSKHFNGKHTHTVEPAVKRDVRARLAAHELATQVLSNSKLVRTLSEISPDTEEPLDKQLAQAHRSLASTAETLSKEVLATISEFVNDVRASELLETLPKSVQRPIERLVTSLTHALEVEEQPHPNTVLLNELWSRKPKAYIFSEENRQLLADYSVAVLENVPPALQNLFDLADVSPRVLSGVISRAEHGERAALQENANQKLRERFQAAWRQSAIYPFVQFEEDAIRVHVRTRDTYAPITERSEGLRTFVALWAFTALRTAGPSPILLIDEAESHLHYDAQADLVKVFYEQNSASQLFYSTHSAGCLPHDLGTGIRVVRPIYDEVGNDTGRSEIRNSFWSEKGAGFSPLLLAMGASVLALVPARRAVVTEGPSDTILLPTMLREISGLADLGFQVAPGVAQVAPNDIADLELEAPRVCYLVDGDKGGQLHANKLTAGGVAPNRISRLGAGMTLEDYLDRDIYVAAVNEELRRSFGEQFVIRTAELRDMPVTNAVQSWCTERKIPAPKKVPVAERVVARRSETRLVARHRRKQLERLLQEFLTTLGLAKQRPL